MKFRHCLSLAGAMLLAGSLSACGSKEDDASGKTTPEAPAAAVTANLAAADAFDGTTDNIISKCLTCKLGMDGKPENTQEIHGYTLHLCDGCKDGLGDDADAVIAAMTIPEKAPEN